MVDFRKYRGPLVIHASFRDLGLLRGIIAYIFIKTNLHRNVMNKTIEADRRFFHSFPRAIAGESEDKTFERALSILRAMKDIGFVLAPEIVEWDNSKFFTWPSQYRLLQRRACFTELHPGELAAHSESFGPISLSLPITSLRRAGAVPAVYVPQATGDDVSQLFQRSIFYLEQIRSDGGSCRKRPDN